MLQAILVEDDPIFRDMLLEMLPRVNPNVQVLDTCATLRQARIAIDKHQPQLLFLDVELPDGKSMDLLDQIDEQGSGNFEVIFVTNTPLTPSRRTRLITLSNPSSPKS